MGYWAASIDEITPWVTNKTACSTETTTLLATIFSSFFVPMLSNAPTYPSFPDFGLNLVQRFCPSIGLTSSSSAPELWLITMSA